MTLREYIIFWQETYDRYQSRSTTYAAHNYVFKNHILPGLGDVLLSELTSEMVGDFLEERRRFGNHRPGSSGLGEETMRHIHRLLQQCLDQAIRDGLMSDNPARAFRYSKPKKVNANVLTPLEMEDYLNTAERLGHLPMFMLALTAGLRQGELIALTWSDLDIENWTLTIAENRAVVRRELVEYGSQTRTIALTPEVIDLLIREHDKHPSSPLMFMHPATPMPDPKVELARRMFIFSSLTGLAYADVYNLYPRHIGKTSEGRLYIRKPREKTEVETFVPLHPAARQILELYNTTDDTRPVFPLPKRDILWYDIHGLGVMLGIQKNLSHHAARHTFGTLLVSEGISIESAAKMMGHADINSTQIYAQITDCKISKDMDRLMERRNSRNEMPMDE